MTPKDNIVEKVKDVIEHCLYQYEISNSHLLSDLTAKAIEAYKSESGVVAELIELDFEKSTATFEIPEGSRWVAGKYKITPAPNASDDGGV